MLINYLFNYIHTQAGTFPFFFCCIEGKKYLMTLIIRNPMPGIDNRKFNMRFILGKPCFQF